APVSRPVSGTERGLPNPPGETPGKGERGREACPCPALLLLLPPWRIFSSPTVSCRSLPLHALDEDPRRLAAHDPRVRQDAGPQLLPQFPAADGPLLVALRTALIDQPHPAQLLVERREADLHRLDEQLALQFVELPLRRQAVPDVLAVVVGGVGVLAADDDVGE